MKRIMRVLDQLPAWACVIAAALIMGSLEATEVLARVARNGGVIDFARTGLFVATIVLVLAAIRRRQTRVVPAAAQGLAAFALANVIALAMVWIRLRAVLTVPLGGVLRAGVTGGVSTVLLGLPLALVMLWLSRRFGSQSTVTERRLRVVQEALARKWRRQHGVKGE